MIRWGRWLLGWLSLAEGFALVLSLGWWDPDWRTTYMMWTLKRLCRAVAAIDTYPESDNDFTIGVPDEVADEIDCTLGASAEAAGKNDADN